MTTGSQLSIGSDMQDYLMTQIEPGEQVLWAGTTDVSARIRRLWPLVIASIFLVFLCSFVSWNSPSRWALVLLSLLVWAGIPAFVYWRQSDHLRRTLYAITNQRALILSLGKPQRTESYPPAKIEFVRPVSRKGGRGDLYFTTLTGSGLDAQSYDHGFLAIPDVHQVASLMRKLLVRQSPSD